MNKRYTVTKGDLGYRIYDRKRGDYVRNRVGMALWYQTKETALGKAKVLNSK